MRVSRRFATLVALMVTATWLLAGCGKKDDKKPTAAVVNTAVTVSGNIQLGAVNTAFATVRGATTAPDFSRFVVTLSDGVASSAPVQAHPTTGAFSVTLPTIARPTATVSAAHDSGKFTLRLRLSGLSVGNTYQPRLVTTTSTARDLMLQANASLTEALLDRAPVLASLSALVNAIETYASNATPASTGTLLDDPTVAGLLRSVASFVIDAGTGMATGTGTGTGTSTGTGTGTATDPGLIVTQNYQAISGLFTSNEQAAASRTAAFMAYVAPDFVDLGGSPARAELESSTLSRFERYTVNAYQFTLLSYSQPDANTVLALTQIDVAVTLKPGQTGAVQSFEGRVLLESNANPMLRWRRQGDGSWKITGGLPFRTSEVSF